MRARACQSKAEVQALRSRTNLALATICIPLRFGIGASSFAVLVVAWDMFWNLSAWDARVRRAV